MNTDRGKLLATDGYERVAIQNVGLGHYVWRVDLEIEFDRALRLMEETVLRLIAAGIGDPKRIEEMMGLSDGRMVPNAIVDLLCKGSVSQRDDRLWVTKQGSDALARESTRQSRSYQDIELRHDPYRDELRWSLEDREFKSDKVLREAGLRALPAPREMNSAELEARYRELQVLLEKEGLPFDSPEEAAGSRRREILRVNPVKCYVAYREASLEVWHHPQRDNWQWRLLRGGGDEAEVSAKLAELESNGEVIIRLDELQDVAPSPLGTEVHQVVEAAQATAKPGILEASEHRAALREAILGAQHELVIVSPWLRTAAVDEELIGWLRTTFDRNKQLKITIGYGIDKSGTKRTDQATRDQEVALRRLRDLADRSKGRFRIVEVGNTHEKVVICDDRYVIITSFNFLSFNPRPGKGIRREMGYRITDTAEVAKVRKRIAEALVDRAETIG